MLRSVLLFSLLFILGCQKSSQSDQTAITEDSKNNEKVIYGDDDRKDIFEIQSSALLELSKSTVALMEKSKLKQNSDGSYNVTSTKYSDDYRLCSSEPFFEQRLAAFCSGSLVGKNLILTAGHCITSQAQCDSTRFVFGFAITEKGKQPEVVRDVYSCKKIVSRALNNSTGLDYAIIELTEKVLNRKPLKVRREGVADTGTPLTVIGHPSGLPLKVASGGKVRNVQDQFFVTSLDTYGGNSGSAVFNSENGEIEGVLVRGEDDYVANGSCNLSNRCAETGCRGEDVTRIDVIRDLIPALEDDDTELPPDPPSQPREYAVAQVIAIPDRYPTGIVSSIEVKESVFGKKVSIGVNIDHTYVGDLKLVLVDPIGKEYILRDRKGGRQLNLVGVFGENLESQVDLKVLSTVDTVGVWKLKVSDLISRDTGTLKSWKIKVE